MQSVRIIEILNCKVVSSGIGMFGDENFEKFNTFISSLPKTMNSRDFLFQDEGGLHWVYLYENWMDVPADLSVIDFTHGGLYAVTTDIDQQTDIDAMDSELHTFLQKNGFEQDKSRPRMGNVITPAQAREVLGYNQMDYYMPIKPYKNDYSCPFLGIASDSTLTVYKFLEWKSEEREAMQEQIQEQTSHIWEMVDCGMANVLKIMKEHYGEEAYQVYVNANSERVRRLWRKKAEEVGDNSIESLIKHLWEPLPTKGYEYTIEKTETGYQVQCTKCPAVAPAKRHGITEQMFHMCCKNDQFIAEGFNPNIGFRMTKTLMQGDDCCNHFYFYRDKNKQL